MNWQQAQIVLLDGSAALVQFAVNWLLQSALLIAIGLVTGRLVASRGSAAQSAVYRTTLAAVLICPVASWLLAAGGFSGWSLAMPRPWTLEVIEPAVVDVPAPQGEPVLPSVADLPVRVISPGLSGQPQGSMPTGAPPFLGETNRANADPGQPIASDQPSEPAAAVPGPLPVFSVHAFGWWSVGLSLGWLLLSAALVGRLIRAWWQLARLRGGAVPAGEATRQICQHVATELGVVAPPVLRSPYLPSPCLAGLRRPVVLLPEADLSLSLRDVLIHELAHLLRRDCHWSLLRHLALSLFFFQPLLWTLSRRLETAAEEVCDDYVVALGGDRNEYAHRLVDIAELSTAPMASAGVGIVSLRSILAQRIRRIMDTSRSLSTRVGNALLVLVVIGGLAGTVVVGLVGVDAQGPAAQAAGEANKSADADPTPVPDAAADDAPITIRGRVLDAAGKPIGGATVRVVRQRFNFEPVYEPLNKTSSDEEGRFEISYRKSQITGDITRAEQWKIVTVSAFKPGYGPGWAWINKAPQEEPVELRLPVDDLAITGRLVDLEGRPLAGVSVECGTLQGPSQGDLSAWIEAIKRADTTVWQHLQLPLISEGTGLGSKLSTDADGRFRLTGVGRERTIELVFEGPSIARTQITAVTRSMPSIAQTTDPSTSAAKIPVVGADFEFALPPTRVIEGVVRDAKTGDALAGVGVQSWKFAKDRRDGDRSIRAVSDARGHFRLVGMPKGTGNRIVAIPNDEQPYLMRTADVPDEPGLGPAKVEFKLHRGIWITGRVTDRVTGRPVSGAAIHYLPFRSNEYARALPEFPPDAVGNVDGTHRYENRYQTAADGSYRLVGLPGPAIVGLSDGGDSYWLGQGASDIQAEKDERGNFATFRNPEWPNDHYWPTALKQINPALGTDLADVDFALDPGGQVEITVVDPAGQPIAGVNVQGKTPHGGTPPVSSPTFVATGFKPTEERTILLRHWKRGLGKAILVHPKDQGKKITVRLEQFAKVKGRLVDQDEKPVTGRTVLFRALAGMSIPLANPITDAQGRFEGNIATGLSFNAFVQGIPGNSTIGKELSAEPGETIDLGTIDVTSDKRPEAVRTKAKDAAPAVPDGNSAATAEGQTTPQDGGSQQFAGNVVDPTGKPVEGAELYLMFYRPQPMGLLASARKPMATTDASGAFRFQASLADFGVAPGAGRFYGFSDLVAVKDGFGFAWALAQDHATSGTQGDGSKPASAASEMIRRIASAFRGGHPLKLVVDDQPIHGRVVDINGRPVPGARLTLLEVWFNERGDLSAWHEAVRRPNADSLSVLTGTSINSPQVPSLVKPAVTDADGRFTLRGVGRGRIAQLLVEGPGIETVKIFARTEEGEKIELVQERQAPQMGSYIYYPAELFHVAGPSVPIIGMVRDEESKAPLAGVTIKSQSRHGTRLNGWGADFVRAVTDAEGRYRLEGMPIGSDNRIAAVPPMGEIAQLAMSRPANTSGRQKPLDVDFNLRRGVWIEGRITDKKTGRGLSGTLQYFVPQVNPSYEFARSLDVDQRESLVSDGQGRFRLAALPGLGFVTFMADEHQIYPRADAILKADGSRQQIGATMLKTNPTYLMTQNYHVVAEVDPADNAQGVVLNLQLDGGHVVGEVVDQFGKPVTDYYYSGKDADFAVWAPSEADKFELNGYDPRSPRHVYFAHQKRSLAAHAILGGELPGKSVVKLEPAGRVKGRLVDGDGLPLANHQLFEWQPSMGGLGKPVDWYHAAPLPHNRPTSQIGEYETDKDGRFEISCLVPNIEYRIQAIDRSNITPTNGRMPTGVGPLDVVIQVAPGESKDLGDVRLADEAKFTEAAKQAKQDIPAVTPQQQTAVTGKITLADGQPAAGAHVAVIAASFARRRPDEISQPGETLAEGKTDAEGNYRLSLGGFSSKTHAYPNLIARQDGYALAWRSIDLDRSAGDVSLALAAEEPIRGRLIDIDGQPATGVRLLVQTVERTRPGRNQPDRNADGSLRDAGVYYYRGDKLPAAWLAPVTSDGQGRFTIHGVPAGHGTSLAVVGTEALAPQEIALNTGKAAQGGEPGFAYKPYWPLVVNAAPGAEAVISLAPAQWFEGTITYRDTAAPAPHARLVIWSEQGENQGGAGVSGQTDASGRYRISAQPGVRFVVAIYPPDGAPYLAQQTGGENAIRWQAGTRVKHADWTLPRGVMVRGKIVDAETNRPVAAAMVQYHPLDETLRRLPAGNTVLRTGDGLAQYSDENGEFTIGVLPGPGRLLVRAVQNQYVLREISEGELNRDAPGDKQNYAHAIERVDPKSDSEVVELTLKLQPSPSITGRIVDGAGRTIDEALMVSRLQLWPGALYWLGGSAPLEKGGRFELSGLGPQEECPLYFLDPKRRLGRKQVVKAGDRDLTVVLKPCGQATARLVDAKGQPRVGLTPFLHLVVTPSAWPMANPRVSAGIDAVVRAVAAPSTPEMDAAAGRRGRLAPNEDYLANIDPTNYQPGPQTDENGRITFPVLIPGATYQLQSFRGKVLKEFSVSTGETLDLGTIPIDSPATVATKEEPAATQAEPDLTIAGRVTLPDGQPAARARVALVAKRNGPLPHGDPGPRAGVLAETTTDAGGYYRLNLPDVSSKSHRDAELIARQDGYAIAGRELNLDDASSQPPIALAVEQPIRGRLVDIDGIAAAGVKLRIHMISTPSKAASSDPAVLTAFRCPSPEDPPEAWPAPITSDREGRFTLHGAAAGQGLSLTTQPTEQLANQHIAINAGWAKKRPPGDMNYWPLVADAAPGEEIVLPIAPAQWFEGQVTYEDTGQPAPHARLTVFASDYEKTAAVTGVDGQADAAGRYRICPHPGVRFAITAYPPDGTPYFGRKTPFPKEYFWNSGDRVKRVDLSLPRGVLVRGTVTEAGSGAPVVAATVNYYPEIDSNHNVVEDILTGAWDNRLSDERGKFEIAVLPGPGRLLVQGPRTAYVFKQTSYGELRTGRPGGQRDYAHGIERIEPATGAGPVDVSFTLQPAATISGRMVDETGGKIDEALVICRLHVPPTVHVWRETGPPARGGQFELSGLDPSQEYPVHFLDPQRRLGATRVVRAHGETPTVVLKPCGQATARFVDSDGEPRAGFKPTLLMIVTPGEEENDRDGMRQGKLSADVSPLANIDRANYMPGPKTDDEGRVTFPALIPGATYAVKRSGPHDWFGKFSVQAGETLDLGDLTINKNR